MNTNPLVLNNGIPATLPLSGSSAFAGYASSAITASSSSVTSASFVTFSNSPAFTFTPTITGKYKVYSSVPADETGVNTIATLRIFNTSGGATLLQESQASLGITGTGVYPTSFIQSVYTLTAGISYVFDIQGQTSGTLACNDTGTTFYMFAEGIGLQSSSNNGITSWNSNLVFTPSTNFGTITNSNIQSRVVGDSLEVRGYFTVGTVTSGTGYIQLPSGYIIDTTKLPPSTTGVGISNLIQSGGEDFTSQNWTQNLFFDGSTNNQLFWGVANSGGSLVKQDVTSVSGSNSSITFQFSVPIVGLSGASSPNPSFSAYLNTTGSFSANSEIVFDTTLFDTNSGYNTSTGQYTAPLTGNYIIGASVYYGSGNTQFWIWKNNTQYIAITQGLGGGTVSGTVAIPLNSGDTIDIRPDTSHSFQGVSGGIIFNSFYAYKI